mmetsp:Transcript_15488/g.23629  ORF Transcript_15488/g.23629 Transcript_15488/m.23629 type:complete len:221 (+) Transcript_15488:59-721(+)
MRKISQQQQQVGFIMTRWLMPQLPKRHILRSREGRSNSISSLAVVVDDEIVCKQGSRRLTKEKNVTATTNERKKNKHHHIDNIKAIQAIQTTNSIRTIASYSNPSSSRQMKLRQSLHMSQQRITRSKSYSTTISPTTSSTSILATTSRGAKRSMGRRRVKMEIDRAQALRPDTFASYFPESRNDEIKELNVQDGSAAQLIFQTNNTSLDVVYIAARNTSL